MPTLKGKAALVTGSSRGIGAAIAKHLASEGAHVAVNYAGSTDRAEGVVAEITGAGGAAFAVQADVGAQDDVTRLFTEVDARFGGALDILVNNAGVFEMHPITSAGLDDFDRTMRINVRGVFDVTRHAVSRLRDNGRIITVGSCMADRSMMPGSAIYSMSKAAVAGLSQGWAHDLGERGITSNVIHPGPIDTDMNPDVAENPAAEMVKAMTTLKRYGTADEVGALAVYLASPASQFVTGQTITIDGGLNA
ncbi:MAG: 3-oxoacyl-ACP reductase family protein [Planctomycetota bacterium]